MSLDRTALRLAACMALTNGFAPPYPTIAGPRVYDSRIDPIQGATADDLVPIVIVATEHHEAENLSQTSGGPPFGNAVDLVLELSIGMIDKEGGLVLSIETEPELEAMLDRFEQQVKWALLRDPVSPWTGWVHGNAHSVATRVTAWRSDVFRERDGSARLSARQIAIKVDLRADADLVIADAAGDPAIPAPLGPLLAAVIAAGGPYAPSAQAIADMLLDTANGEFVSSVLPKLERVRMIEADHAELDGDDEPAGLRHEGVAQADLT